MKYKTKTQNYLGLLLTLLTVSKAFSQNALDQYVQIGLESNQQYIRQLLDTDIAKEEVKNAKGLFLPDVYFDASYMRAKGGRTIDLPVGDLLNPVYTTLNQQTGINQFPKNIENVSEQLLPNNFHETKIKILLPILNTDIYFAYKAKTSLVSLNEAKEQAYRNQLIFQIKKAYYNYLKAVAQKTILDSTKLVVKELVNINSKHVEHGVATEDAMYNAKAQLFQIDAELASVEKHIHTSRNYFNFLLNRDLEDEIVTEIVTPNTKELYEANDLQQEALKNRSELQQIQQGIEASSYEIKRNKGYLIPDISAFSEFGYQGFDYKFDASQDYYMIGVKLSYPIFQGGTNKAKTQKAKYKKQQLETDFTDLKSKIRLEVSDAFYSYKEAFKIHESRLAQLKSEEANFKIIETKYKQNLVLLIEYNDANSRLTRVKITESLARYDILIAQAYLDKTIQIQ